MKTIPYENTDGNVYMMFPKPTPKPKKEKKPLRKKKVDSKSKAKEKAWKVFSLYIRTLNSADGMNECYTCGNLFPINRLQAGHGIGGRNNAVLFNEQIVKPQCVGCNMFANGRYAVFTRKLIDELGLDGYDAIVAESVKPLDYTLEDYVMLEKFYKIQLEKLNDSDWCI